MLRLFLILVLACAAAFAQVEYRYEHEATLSASTTAWTIQQPASPTATVRFTGLSFYCSAACTITLSRSCTTASATSDTSAIRAVSPDVSRATALTAFRASNAASCSSVKTYNVPAGVETVIPSTALRLSRTAGQNIHVSVASMTGTVRLYAQWTEQ